MTRTNATEQQLHESDLLPEPIVQFRIWFDEALRAEAQQPHAMTLATASRNGIPSARIVLLKSLDERGFTFVTNHNSRKGQELEENPHAALVFHWAEMGRQVRVEGSVEQVCAEESDALFAARPRDNQLSSAASRQSEVTTLEELDLRFEELKRTYAGLPIPRPGHWGGYRVRPERMEFWQHRFARMNDRVLYVRSGNGQWNRMRLAP